MPSTMDGSQLRTAFPTSLPTSGHVILAGGREAEVTRANSVSCPARACPSPFSLSYILDAELMAGGEAAILDYELQAKHEDGRATKWECLWPEPQMPAD